MARFKAARLLRRKDKGPPPLADARIVVGLGNPGPQYARTRHNVGARAAADVARLLNLPPRDRTKHALSGQGETPYGAVVVAQTRTYMNESGLAVQSLLTRHGAKPSQLIVLCSELDLEPGRIRLRGTGGDAGQKGMRSIKQTIGTTDFPRVRIGVGRPWVGGQSSHDPDVIAEHLLSEPGAEEARLLREAEGRAAEAVVAILREGVEAAMNQYNG